MGCTRPLGLPCATLWNQSCAVLSLYHHFYDDDTPFPSTADDAPVALPGLPAMSLHELPLMVRPEFAHNLWGQMLRRQLVEPVLAACRGDTGRIVAWCPQGRVLRHGAVGCFVTHCGWNSVTEALAAGVPVVAYPWWSDQFTNAKFLVEEFGVGVRLPAPVTQDGFRACIEEVMSGPEAVAIRRRATAWKEEAAAALADGGSSDRGLEAFVDFVRAPVGSGGVDTISSPAKQGSVSSL
ncbi:Limonoid UDP-glucosyltransferase [Triticum urartu]|uniref:Limonoid UDP-glucosyltransferase n=1 Tax=Triticum urartu TaxID=4572 RepID=M7YL02_TRIUA|nr:Limonoid UDP-glucosyltransferase [Triticum urartu]